MTATSRCPHALLRQGPRHLRRRRRPAADGHLRSPVGVRRGARRADPRQGPRAHGHVGVLVRGARRRASAATWCPPTSPTSPPGWPSRPRPRRAHHAVPPGRDAADRVHRARLPLRLGVEGVHGRAARCTAHALPAGLQERDQLPEPVFTPSTKSDVPRREHLLRASRRPRRRTELADQARDVSLELYRRGAAWAARARHHHRRHQVRARPRRRRAGGLRRGADARLVAASGRRTSGSPARRPPSFDKQPVRDYLETLDWDKNPPPPPLPAEVVAATSGRYIEAYERITGRSFADWPGVPESHNCFSCAHSTALRLLAHTEGGSGCRVRGLAETYRSSGRVVR